MGWYRIYADPERRVGHGWCTTGTGEPSPEEHGLRTCHDMVSHRELAGMAAAWRAALRSSCAMLRRRAVRWSTRP